MTEYGPAYQYTPTCQQHCWHVDLTLTASTTVYPPATPRVCCHCGVREWYRPPTPPIPDGHGPFYPRSGPFTFTYGFPPASHGKED